MSSPPDAAPGSADDAPEPGAVVVIDGFTHGGEGVGRIDGRATFVPGTIPGERVRVEVVDDRGSWARARLLEVLEASPDRVAPPCPFVPECGGCDLQHIAPDRQRALKRRVVTEQLERLGGLDEPPVERTRPVGSDTRYRTRARLHADPRGRLGFHRRGTHEVVPVDDCLVLSEPAQAVREAVGDATGATEVAVRAHERTGDSAAVLTPGPGPLDVPGGDFDLLLAQPDGRTVALRGDGELTERVAGFTFTFDPSCFFQANTDGAEAIVAAVREAAGDVGGALLWDLYAGVGLLSLPLAADGAEVVAVEGHERSASYLADNAAAAELSVAVVDEAVEDHVLAGGAQLPDVVVLDPPRAGAGQRICAELAELGPAAVVYVSCDPASLARDAGVLAEHGLALRRAVPLDLFPMTHHVEIVAAFRR